MRQFLLETTVFIFILFSFFVLLSHSERPDINHYMAGMIDKHRLLDSTLGKRIIIAGGSNMTFGINSKIMSTVFHRPVINMSIHAALGLDFIINEINDVVRQGDLVLLSVEYYMPLKGDYRLQKFTSNIFPKASRYFADNYYQNLQNLMENGVEGIKTNFNKIGKKQATGLPTIYQRKSFNQYGDIEGQDKFSKDDKLDDAATLRYSYFEGISALNRLGAELKAKRVTILFLYPAYAESQYDLNKKVIEKYSSDLKNNLSFPIISSPIDFVYQDSLFFDTIYHLKEKGRDIRTEKLITLMKEKRVL